MIGIAKDQVERPFKLHGYGTAILNFDNGTWTFADKSGEATHLGLFTMPGAGTFIPSFTGTGSLLAANGDEVFWYVEQAGPEYPAFFTITGGTGRFEGASGSFAIMTADEIAAWDGNLLIVTHSLSGVGTITY